MKYKKFWHYIFTRIRLTIGEGDGKISPDVLTTRLLKCFSFSKLCELFIIKMVEFLRLVNGWLNV